MSRTLVGVGLTALQRCSRYILQPQPTGQPLRGSIYICVCVCVCVCVCERERERERERVQIWKNKVYSGWFYVAHVKRFSYYIKPSLGQLIWNVISSELYIYIYIYIYMCVCVCVWRQQIFLKCILYTYKTLQLRWIHNHIILSCYIYTIGLH